MSELSTAPRTPPRRPDSPPRAWVELLRAHASLTRRMDATLREQHGLSLNEFEVLLQLWINDDHRLRRVDLAERLLITQGGVTRLLAGLERQELVARAGCETDRRVVYAELTPAGTRKLEAARPAHLADVRRLFSEGYTDPELEQLGELLGRLGEGVTEEPC